MKMICLLKSENLKLPYDNNSLGIISLLSEKYDNYLKELNDFYSTVLSSDIARIIDDVKMTTDGIIDTLQKYLLGDIIGAGITFNDIMGKNQDSIMKVSKYYGQYTFHTYYRALLKSKKGKTFNNKKEYLHIPFELRHLVSNQRYSVSGFPCMYLGATPYTCYEELGRPDQNIMSFVKVEIPKEYNLITIGLLPYELKNRLYKQKDIDNVDIISAYLKMLPIIMSCSVKVDIEKKGAAFKEEYIIPQLITQWLIKSGREFDGILYFSNATLTHSRINYRLYQNVVLPVKKIERSGYCKKLSKEIKLTSPIHISRSRIKLFKEYKYKCFQNQDGFNELPGNGRINSGKSEIHYSASGFRLLECKLSKLECSVIG